MNLERKLKNALKSNNSDKLNTVFSDIYNEYGKLVYFIIMQYIACNEDVEELTQDVFISFYNNILKNEKKNIKYYLVVSAKNKAINFLKTKKENIVLNENIIYETLDEEYQNAQYKDIILKLKEYLSEFEIEIIIKRIVYEYSFSELSSIYNKPVNTIISTYHRAVKKFKKRSSLNEK